MKFASIVSVVFMCLTYTQAIPSIGQGSGMPLNFAKRQYYVNQSTLTDAVVQSFTPTTSNGGISLTTPCPTPTPTTTPCTTTSSSIPSSISPKTDVYNRPTSTSPTVNSDPGGYNSPTKTSPSYNTPSNDNNSPPSNDYKSPTNSDPSNNLPTNNSPSNRYDSPSNNVPDNNSPTTNGEYTPKKKCKKRSTTQSISPTVTDPGVAPTTDAVIAPTAASTSSPYSYRDNKFNQNAVQAKSSGNLSVSSSILALTALFMMIV